MLERVLWDLKQISSKLELGRKFKWVITKQWNNPYLRYEPGPALRHIVVELELYFSKTCSFCRELEDHYYFHIQVKIVYMNELGFCQNPTKLIIGPFWGLFGWAVLIHQNIFPKFTYYLHTTLSEHHKHWKDKGCENVTGKLSSQHF